ncbi:EutP/PduV family microcompartment system protein [Candidatus Formimonas warabiya]|nr:EutP/PduV family microcompartment system protein [Candidatus Formimonas warabiya]
MLIGPTGAGKTTLSHALTGSTDQARKTQMIHFVGDFMDTPGEYLEIPRFYRALLVSAQQADRILLVVAADKPELQLPHGFAQAFSRPVIGVINKIDRVGCDLPSAYTILGETGVKEPYFPVSAATGQGLTGLKIYLGL